MANRDADDSGKPEGASVEPLRKPRPCPICEKPSSREAYPFCSKRCADVDLSRWLKGSYAVPAQEEDLPDEEDEAGLY
ncbi:DNA gyrase inhibitor YacG [Coralliovum pocilloporae]|uniref:DNA gyrase inhibitor YacG n=1 Tax=Coralliovum pocilloporae TaxID=3066369 RepID=UPI003307662D